MAFSISFHSLTILTNQSRVKTNPFNKRSPLGRTERS
jgi:hypothetical protein